MNDTKMNVQEAYNVWAENYDTVQNKTRDLEATALRASVLATAPLDVLEIGCGTGKNTEWLLTKAKNLVASDFSSEMLAKAKGKITAKNVEFKQFDLRDNWGFSENQFDLITCSLALEHIEDINFVFGQANKVLRTGGLLYIGELHPFKQYQGSKARFDTGDGIFELKCFVHHVSEFFAAAKNNNFECVDLKEWFDDDDKKAVPRLLTMIFKTKK
ncbi:MAG: class I SAM-dependent methyltransferase [Acidobacteriota bacterium]|nr:class I SAM-dependent methyltransferase [Acidobacteriota bacterium]